MEEKKETIINIIQQVILSDVHRCSIDLEDSTGWVFASSIIIIDEIQPSHRVVGDPH